MPFKIDLSKIGKEREEGSGKIIPLGCMVGIVIAVFGLIGIGIYCVISSSKVTDLGAANVFGLGGFLAFVFGVIIAIVYWK